MNIGDVYLDLDQFLDTIYNEYMLISTRSLPDNGLISCPHPPVLECLCIGLVIVQIAQDDARRFDHELSRLIVSCDLCALGRNNFGLH